MINSGDLDNQGSQPQHRELAVGNPSNQLNQKFTDITALEPKGHLIRAKGACENLELDSVDSP